MPVHPVATLKGLPFFIFSSFFLSGDRKKNKKAEAETRTLSANLSKRLIVLSPAGSKGAQGDALIAEPAATPRLFYWSMITRGH